MRRFFIERLEKWAESHARKPLVLSVARQVGKTWLLKEFGHTHFSKTAYVNFERHPELNALFEGAFRFMSLDRSPSAFVSKVSIHHQESVLKMLPKGNINLV